MKWLVRIVIALLVFLAVSSGFSKLLLLPQDMEFFGRYGFTPLMLRGLGLMQIIGGVLFALPRTRFLGALIVAITFIWSAALLYKSGSLPVAALSVVIALVMLWLARRRPHSTG